MNLYLTNLIFLEKYFDNNEYRNLIQNKKIFESLMIERFKCEKNLRLSFVIYIYIYEQSTWKMRVYNLFANWKYGIIVKY